MPITGIIPGLTPPGEELSKVGTDMMNAMLARAQQRESLARAQEATGNAAKSNMIAKLMNVAFGGNQQNPSSNSVQNINSTTSSNDRTQQAKSILQAFGVLHQTPEEKEESDIRVAKAKSDQDVAASAQEEQNKSNIQRSQDLIETGNLINKYAQHSIPLSLLLEKKNVTGNIPAFENLLNLGGEDVGKFNENATPLVGQLAKELSTRGGAIVSGMASAAKPMLRKGRAYNLGVLNELHKQTYQAYKAAKEEYEHINPGKTYPIKLPKFYERVRIQSPLGHIAIKSPEDAKMLLKKYPGSKIIGLAYDEQ